MAKEETLTLEQRVQKSERWIEDYENSQRISLTSEELEYIEKRARELGLPARPDQPLKAA